MQIDHQNQSIITKYFQNKLSISLEKSNFQDSIVDSQMYKNLDDLSKHIYQLQNCNFHHHQQHSQIQQSFIEQHSQVLKQMVSQIYKNQNQDPFPMDIPIIEKYQNSFLEGEQQQDQVWLLKINDLPKFQILELVCNQHTKKIYKTYNNNNIGKQYKLNLQMNLKLQNSKQTFLRFLQLQWNNVNHLNLSMIKLSESKLQILFNHIENFPDLEQLVLQESLIYKIRHELLKKLIKLKNFKLINIRCNPIKQEFLQQLIEWKLQQQAFQFDIQADFDKIKQLNLSNKFISLKKFIQLINKNFTAQQRQCNIKKLNLSFNVLKTQDFDNLLLSKTLFQKLHNLNLSNNKIQNITSINIQKLSALKNTEKELKIDVRINPLDEQTYKNMQNMRRLCQYKKLYFICQKKNSLCEIM